MVSEGMRRSFLRAVLGFTLLASMVIGLAPNALAGPIHVDCATQNLQAKIDSAAAGSTLLVKGTCVGTFTVNKNLTLKGNPSSTLDGNKAGTTLTVSGTHTVHLIGLL